MTLNNINSFVRKALTLLALIGVISVVSGCGNSNATSDSSKLATPAVISPSPDVDFKQINSINEADLKPGGTVALTTDAYFIPLIPEDGLKYRSEWKVETGSSDNIEFTQFVQNPDSDSIELYSGFHYISAGEAHLTLVNEKNEKTKIKFNFDQFAHNLDKEVTE